MVTITKIGEEYNSQILEISGLSTDPKPVDQIDGVSIANGSTFKEIDTGKEYTYNESAETWHINKSASSGGGSGVDGEDGGYYTPGVTQPTTDTMQISFAPSKSDMPAVDPVIVNLPVSENSGQNPNGAGLTAEEKSLMLTLFNNALYGADIGAVKARLNALWGGEAGDGSGGDSGNTDPGALYTISTKFVNVTIDNTATSATANSAFNATLTPTTGDLASVTIIMGGVDVTADVYVDGIITIPAVTGNIVIEASASAYVNLIADAEWRAGTKEDWENGLTYNKNSGRDYTFSAGTYYFYGLHKNAAGGTPSFYIPNGDGTYTILDSSNYTSDDNNGLFKDGKFNEYGKETSSYYQPVDELYLIEATVTFHQDVTARIVFGSGWYILEHPEYVWCFDQRYNPHKDILGLEV